MVTMTTTPFTPEYTKTLRDARESGHTSTYLSHVKALRTEGWPLSVIAEALQVSKTTVSAWERREDYTPEPVSVPPYPKIRELSDFERQNLTLLTKKSSKVCRFTPQNAPGRTSALALEKTLLHLHAEGITVTELAKACGVTRRAINQRLEKY